MRGGQAARCRSECREPTGSDAQDPRSARWRIQSPWRPAASCRRCKRRLRPRPLSDVDTNVGGAVILRYATRDLVLGIEAVLRRSDHARRRPERPAGAKLADMTALRLIADDLTGALDTAAEFVGLVGPVPVFGLELFPSTCRQALPSTAARGSLEKGRPSRGRRSWRKALSTRRLPTRRLTAFCAGTSWPNSLLACGAGRFGTACWPRPSPTKAV